MDNLERFLGALFALFVFCASAADSPLRGEDGTLVPGTTQRSAIPIDIEAAEAASKKRIALVVGNSDYRTLPDLRNAANDARALATVLRRVGFDVAVGIDLDAVAFRKALQNFLEPIDQDTVALFFYAGHGLQVNGLNYMLPVDAQLASQIDLEFETIKFNLLLEPMESNSYIGIVFLDACRDNPLANTLSRTGKNRSLGSRGLAPVQTGDGLFIGYATQPDNVAADGSGPNSPFTTALLHHLETPGFDIEMLMRRVRDDVIAATDRAQIPWSNSSLSSEGFSFKPANVTGLPAATIPVDPGAADRQLELELWRSVSASNDASLLDGYLQRYPKGIFSDIARSRLKALKKTSKRVPVGPTETTPSKRKTVTTRAKPLTAQRSTASQASSQSRSETSSQTSGRCRHGNAAKCRVKCARGEKRACDKLRRMGL